MGESQPASYTRGGVSPLGPRAGRITASEDYSIDPEAPAIYVGDLVKSFKGRRVLDGVSFSVRSGERVALLGPNGAGKTTTILTVLGVVAPDSGTVRLRGLPIPAQRRRAMERTGFAAGYLALPDLMRVREALTVFADFYGVDDPRARAREVASVLGIEHLWDSFNGTLSAGQKTLVNLAKALLCKPEVLVLDEPTASLDPDVARRTRRLLLELWSESRFAILVTSHNMREVEEMAERVIFLHRGRVVADDSPGAVAHQLGAADLEEAFVELSESGDLREAVSLVEVGSDPKSVEGASTPSPRGRPGSGEAGVESSAKGGETTFSDVDNEERGSDR